jgi:hypothetical protein
MHVYAFLYVAIILILEEFHFLFVCVLFFLITLRIYIFYDRSCCYVSKASSILWCWCYVYIW